MSCTWHQLLKLRASGRLGLVSLELWTHYSWDIREEKNKLLPRFLLDANEKANCGVEEALEMQDLQDFRYA